MVETAARDRRRVRLRSSWGRDRPAAWSPTACRPTAPTGCCCSRRRQGTLIWFLCRWDTCSRSATQRSDWMFETRPEPGLNGRALQYPRGKVIGGSSAINAMISMRGQASDYDHCASLGWSGGLGRCAGRCSGGWTTTSSARASTMARRRVAGGGAAGALGRAGCGRQGAIQMGVPATADFQHRRQYRRRPVPGEPEARPALVGRRGGSWPRR